MQPSIPPIGRSWTFSTSQVDLTHSDDYHYCIEVKTIVVKLVIFTIVLHNHHILCVKSTCEVENVQRRPMGGIDSCILLLGNELLMYTLSITQFLLHYECMIRTS